MQPRNVIKHVVPSQTDAEEIRIEQLSADRVAEVARLHRSAFRGSIGVRLGDRYARALIDCYRSDAAISLVAIDRTGQALGYAMGAPLDYARTMNRQLLLPAAVGMILHPGLFCDARFRSLLRSYLRLLAGKGSARHDEPPLPGPTTSLVGIGVDPAAQGRGVGAALLAQFERLARERQARSLRLTVYADNLVARRIYEKCGWQPCEPRDERYPTLFYKKILND